MASKRQRDEAQVEEMSEGEELKRQKSYNQILSLLEEEEEEVVEDLSSIMTSLQQEICSSPCSTKWHPISKQNKTQEAEAEAEAGSAECASLEDCASTSSSSSSSSVNSPKCMKEEEAEGGERERVMRRLLEASDDELGIPSGEFVVGEGVDGVALCDALWELEDEAANYYTLFQSQLFM